MMYKKTHLGYIIRIEQGEEILKALTSFAQTHKIEGSFFYGLGAIREAVVGMYHLGSFEYEFHDYGASEITNISGNIALFENTVKIHAHITLAGVDGKAFGGHVQSAVAEPTCEIILTPTDTLTRVYDEKTGLPLLNLSSDLEA